MSKKSKFVATGRMLLADNTAVAPGDVLTLEVGDDGLPSERIYRNRVKPQGKEVGAKDSHVEDAKAQAKKILADAEEQATKVLADAHAAAEKVKAGK